MYLDYSLQFYIEGLIFLNVDKEYIMGQSLIYFYFISSKMSSEITLQTIYEYLQRLDEKINFLTVRVNALSDNANQQQTYRLFVTVPSGSTKEDVLQAFTESQRQLIRSVALKEGIADSTAMLTFSNQSDQSSILHQKSIVVSGKICELQSYFNVVNTANLPKKKALFNFTPNGDNQIALKEGDQVLEVKVSGAWTWVKNGNKQGYVPTKYLQPL